MTSSFWCAGLGDKEITMGSGIAAGRFNFGTALTFFSGVTSLSPYGSPYICSKEGQKGAKGSTGVCSFPASAAKPLRPRCWAPLKATTAPSLTMSTVSRTPSLSTPAPFSRTSPTARPNSSMTQGKGFFGVSSTLRMSTSSSSPVSIRMTRALGGSEMLSTPWTLPITQGWPLDNEMGTSSPCCGSGSPGGRRRVGRSSASSCAVLSTRAPPASWMRSTASKLASLKAPQAPFSRKSSKVPLISSRSTFQK
mmetsp:Transcript_121356/g.288328  ORF Transcript_121356/g.288328 Transcript_121356/m.288328 type:complete len:251 (+) Transcript_121356:321-1073(+)